MSFDVTVISFMSIIPMLHVFVFPSVTDVIITRHRQNIYLPWIGGVEGEGVAAVQVMVAVLTDGGVAVAGGADSVTGGEIGVGEMDPQV